MPPNDKPMGRMVVRQERPPIFSGCRLSREPVFKKEIVRQTAEAGTVEIIEYRNYGNFRTKQCDFVVTKETQYVVWICPMCGDCRKRPSPDSPLHEWDRECEGCEEKMVPLRVYVVWKKDVKKKGPPLRLSWRDPDREEEWDNVSPEEAIERAIQEAGGHPELKREPEVEWLCTGCRKVVPDSRVLGYPVTCTQCHRPLHRIRKTSGYCLPSDFERLLLRPL